MSAGAALDVHFISGSSWIPGSVMGQFLRNSLFLQAFYEGRDRGGIFGKSRLISSAYVLSMMWKTPESNKSHFSNVSSWCLGGFLHRHSSCGERRGSVSCHDFLEYTRQGRGGEQSAASRIVFHVRSGPMAHQ